LSPRKHGAGDHQTVAHRHPLEPNIGRRVLLTHALVAATETGCAGRAIRRDRCAADSANASSREFSLCFADPDGLEAGAGRHDVEVTRSDSMSATVAGW